MIDELSLKEALKKIADEYWGERKQPLLLSALPEKLSDAVGDYKDVIGNRSLKSFILSSGEGFGFKLIAHPTQSAKLGLLPVEANFEFPAEEEAPQQRAIVATQERTRERGIRSQEPVLTLLRALRALPAEELEKVVIPVSVLVKLLK